MHAYNFDLNALTLIYSYLSDRKQRTKINSSCTWHDISGGVPQGSILGPLLFNIYINDIFFCIQDVDIANFADDNSPYVVDKRITGVLNLLENDANKMYKWYEHNWLKPNSDKYHLLLSSHDENLELTINNDKVKNTSEVKLLGITPDNEFSCIKTC